MLFVRRVIASDFIGSATIFVSMKLHLAHSNIRFSKPSLRVSNVLSDMRVLHLRQRGYSMVDILTRTFEAITLTLSSCLLDNDEILPSR